MVPLPDVYPMKFTSAPQTPLDGEGTMIMHATKRHSTTTATPRPAMRRNIGLSLILATLAFSFFAARPAVAQTYPSYPASFVSCSAPAPDASVTCTVNAPIDANTPVVITIGNMVSTFTARGGTESFGPLVMGATTADISYVVSGTVYGATVTIIVVSPTAVPTATPIPPLPPKPLAVTGTSSGYLIAVGVAMAGLGIFLLASRRYATEI